MNYTSRITGLEMSFLDEIESGYVIFLGSKSGVPAGGRHRNTGRHICGPVTPTGASIALLCCEL